MLKFYYFNQIYIQLIKILILSKFNFKKNLILKLLNKSFTFVFFKVLLITVKRKIMFIHIPTYTDYCISFIMKNILEEVFKSKFQFGITNNSFDFFNNIRKWTNVKWCLKGRFINFLNQVDFFLVGQYLFFYTKDIFFLNLYFRFISAGYWYKKTNLLFSYYFGQKHSFGFLLVNIYLYELDRFIQNYIQHWNLLFFNVKLYLKKKIFYIRFGLFWFLGLNGSFNVVSFLKQKLYIFFYIYLGLSLRKHDTQIISLLTSSIFCFGVEIKSLQSFAFIQLFCPIRKVLFNFLNLGFLKYYKNKLIPCAQRKWVSLDCSDLFWRYYLLKIRLFNLYFFVTNFSVLFMLKYFLKMSLIFTLGRKLKLSKKQITFKFKSSLFKWMS